MRGGAAFEVPLHVSCRVNSGNAVLGYRLTDFDPSETSLRVGRTAPPGSPVATLFDMTLFDPQPCLTQPINKIFDNVRWPDRDSSEGLGLNEVRIQTKIISWLPVMALPGVDLITEPYSFDDLGRKVRAMMDRGLSKLGAEQTPIVTSCARVTPSLFASADHSFHQMIIARSTDTPLTGPSANSWAAWKMAA